MPADLFLCWGQTGQGPAFLSHLTACQNVLSRQNESQPPSNSWILLSCPQKSCSLLPDDTCLLIQVFPGFTKPHKASILQLGSFLHHRYRPAVSRLVAMTTNNVLGRVSGSHSDFLSSTCPEMQKKVFPDQDVEAEDLAERGVHLILTSHFSFITFVTCSVLPVYEMHKIELSWPGFCRWPHLSGCYLLANLCLEERQLF